jgi:N-acyl-D-amino-acid deacylase
MALERFRHDLDARSNTLTLHEDTGMICNAKSAILCLGAILATIQATRGQGSPSAPTFDLVIAHGHIVDGTGSPWYSGDLGIRDGRIAAIGNLENTPRKRTIDAQGRVVAPGFIDMLGQSEITILVDPRLPSKIYQGITTEITGEGNSAAPLNDAMLAADRAEYEHYHLMPDWQNFRQYFARIEKQGMGINLASYVGATSVRRMVLGDADVQPTPAQLEQMKGLVRDAMRDGAAGLSTALQYAPAPYAKTPELVALAGAAAQFGGMHWPRSAHPRRNLAP